MSQFWASQVKPRQRINLCQDQGWAGSRGKDLFLDSLQLFILVLAPPWSSASNSWVFLGFWSWNWLISYWFPPLVIILISDLLSICLPSQNFCLFLVCDFLLIHSFWPDEFITLVQIGKDEREMLVFKPLLYLTGNVYLFSIILLTSFRSSFLRAFYWVYPFLVHPDMSFLYIRVLVLLYVETALLSFHFGSFCFHSLCPGKRSLLFPAQAGNGFFFFLFILLAWCHSILFYSESFLPTAFLFSPLILLDFFSWKDHFSLDSSLGGKWRWLHFLGYIYICVSHSFFICSCFDGHLRLLPYFANLK